MILITVLWIINIIANVFFIYINYRQDKLINMIIEKMKKCEEDFSAQTNKLDNYIIRNRQDLQDWRNQDKAVDKRVQEIEKLIQKPKVVRAK
jgi:hypothetical protein